MLIGADRNERAAWALKRLAAEDRLDLVVPAPVLAQAWRGPGSVNVARFVGGLLVAPLDAGLARAAGALCGRAATNDIVDAAVAALAQDGDRIITGDPRDLSHLIELTGRRVAISAYGPLSPPGR